jgi:hypothetical protein
MDLPSINHKEFTLILLVMMGIITCAYLVFLYGSWEQFQQDRLTRDNKINELLDRLPKRKDVPDVPATES